MVVAWHFIHASNGYPVPFDYTPAVVPFSLLDEGHTGVALFMTLSGYLFAKLLDGRAVNFVAFAWNRALRLLPLLLFVIVIVGLSKLKHGEDLQAYAYSIAKGAVFPVLPNGGWSITVEIHYYLILPLLLWLLAKSKYYPLWIVVAAIAMRTFLYCQNGEVQSMAYWTIAGRIDQFVLGMLGYHFRFQVANRKALAAVTLGAFTMIYWIFDFRGGFYENPSYPSSSALWVLLPTLEGFSYAVGIAWYDSSFSPSTSRFSKVIARFGEYSYSIYLLHPFWVFRAAKYVDGKIMDISNFYLACLWSLIFFFLMIIPGYISFRFIESPFLRLRKNYVRSNAKSMEVVS